MINEIKFRQASDGKFSWDDTVAKKINEIVKQLNQITKGASMYVYLQSEVSPDLFTVGHYDPKGQFLPEGDYKNNREAAARVNYLNGGPGNVES